MQSGTYSVGDDAMFATVYALRPDTTAGFRPTPAFVVNHGIDLWFSFAAEDAVESLKFDGLQAIVKSPHFCKLVIASDDSESNQYKTFKRILHSVLERKKLAWALDSHKLQFDGSGKDEIIRSADILSVPTKYTGGDISISLSRPSGYYASRSTRGARTYGLSRTSGEAANPGRSRLDLHAVCSVCLPPLASRLG